jgi:hypothetical protein
MRPRLKLFLGADRVFKTLYLGRQGKCALMKGTVAVDSEAFYKFINDRLLIAD